MRLANRYFQHVARRTPTLGVRELDVEVDGDVGDMVAVLALSAVAGAADLEAGGARTV